MFARTSVALVAVLGLLAVGLLPASGSHAASEVYENPPAASGGELAVAAGVAQGFLAPRAGMLDWVEFGTRADMSGLVRVELTRADFAGVPSSAVIATPSSFEQRDGYYRFGFDGVRVAAGTRYAVALHFRAGATMRIGGDPSASRAALSGASGPWSSAASSIAHRVQISDIAPSIGGTPRTILTKGFRYDFGYTVDGAPSPSVTATGLPPGLTMSSDGQLSGTPTHTGTWTFDVTAHNGAGSATISSTIEIVEQSLPDPPTITSVVVTGTSAAVHWSPPAFDGGHRITFYRIAVEPGGLTCASGASPCRVHGLQRGIEYTATARAQSVSLLSAPSEPSAPFTGEFAPLPPREVTAVAGEGSATVHWMPPADPGSGPIMGYRADASPGGASCSTVADGRGCAISGLDNGETYTITVTAHNASGASTRSSAAHVIPVGPPLAPSDIVAESADASAVVKWSAADPQGSPVTAYHVTAEPGGASCTSGGTRCTVTGLDNGTSYRFTVRAENEVGSGRPSGSSDPVVPAGRPGAPRDVRVVADDGLLIVLWSAPDDDNGSPLVAYRVDGTGDLSCTVPAGGQRVCVFDSLANGDDYSFTVAATTAAGDSLPSSRATGTPFGRPTAPSGITTVPGAASVLVSWTPPDGNGRPVLVSTVTAAPGGAVCVSATASCRLEGLAPGVEYSFTVTSSNAAGISTPSSPTRATTLPLPEPEPETEAPPLTEEQSESEESLSTPSPSPPSDERSGTLRGAATLQLDAAAVTEPPSIGSIGAERGDGAERDTPADERADEVRSAGTDGASAAVAAAAGESSGDGVLTFVLIVVLAVGLLLGAAGAFATGRLVRRRS